MPRTLRDAVVVITGASSGIGRATALAFAQRGARLVVAARREAALRELAAECERLGPPALAVPTDVTEEAAVRQLAERAVERFGRIDVWVNNAGVYLAGHFEDVPLDAYRRVVETNLFGYVHGARAALPHLRRSGGVLINNASMAGRAPMANFNAYVASKFAVLGFSECLRQELRGSGVEVCTVLPAAIDTPIFQHAGNYSGRAIKAMRPIYPAEKVAQAIVRLAERPRRQVTVGASARVTIFMRTLLPGPTDRLVAKLIEHDHFRAEPAPPHSGILFAPEPRWTSVSGGWRRDGAGLLGRLGGIGSALTARLRRSRESRLVSR